MIKNYNNKAEMEKTQREFLRQAMEMAKRSRSVYGTAEASDGMTEDKNGEKKSRAASAKTVREAESVTEETEETAVNMAEKAEIAEETVNTAEEIAEDAEVIEETETSDDNAEAEEPTTFFPASCAAVFADKALEEDENVKSAYEILDEISDSSSILGGIIVDEGKAEAASELPPPSFANRIDTHNKGIL